MSGQALPAPAITLRVLTMDAGHKWDVIVTGLDLGSEPTATVAKCDGTSAWDAVARKYVIHGEYLVTLNGGWPNSGASWLAARRAERERMGLNQAAHGSIAYWGFDTRGLAIAYIQAAAEAYLADLTAARSLKD